MCNQSIRIFSVYLLLLCWHGVFANHDYCPVSSLINIQTDQMNPLPIDVFEPDRIPAIDAHSIYTCMSATGEHHSCTLETNCILTEDDRLAFISLGTGGLDSLCDVRSALRDNGHKIRVEIYGGSMPFGAAAFGCCCDHNIEAKCPDKPLDPRCGTMQAMGGEEMCRWGNRLETWFKTISVENVHYHNHAYSGANSLEAAHYLTKDTKGSFYTKYDIIFLDFSVNDAKYFASRGSSELKMALQNMIRQIFYNAEPDSWPTVILLEEYPWASGMQKSHQFEKSPTLDYNAVYVEVAKEFKIPLWSYREFALQAMRNNRHQTAIEYLLLEKEGGAHPRWFMHLLYADLIAASLQHSFHQCSLGSELPPTHRTPKDMVFDSLPGKSDPRTCKRGGRLLLDASVEHTIRSDSIPFLGDLNALPAIRVVEGNIVGRIYATPAGSWGAVDDGKQRFGWVNCNGLNASVIASLAPRSCPTPSTNALEQAILRFELSRTAMGVLNRDNSAYLFQVKYFRTYAEVAGAMDVYFCNRKLGRLESRWDTAHMAHFSVPETFFYEYEVDGAENYWCDTSKPVAVEFRSIGTGRVKVISVSICEQDRK